MPDSREERDLRPHSEDVQEILSYVPHVLVRWGSTIIALIMVGMLLASYFIRYPEIIPARVVVQSSTPASKVVARTSGRIQILQANNSMVKAGDLLGVVENAGKTADILRARSIADSIRGSSLDSLKNPLLPQLILGSAQAAYLQFAEDFRSAVYRLQDEFTLEKISNLKSQIVSLENLNNKLIQQKASIREELQLAKQEFVRNKSLFEAGVISQAEFDKQSATYLAKQRQLDDIELRVINNKIQKDEYEKLLIDLEQSLSETLSAIKSNLYQSLSYLDVAINEWFYQYALVAPSNGLLSYYRFFGANELVQAGDPVFAVLSNDQNVQVWAEVPLTGAGKIKEGQRVNIKLESYPYKEYGMLIGEIKAITALPDNNSYRLLIGLPEGLSTTYNIQLTFKEQMVGLGEVLTKELSLFDRIFNELRSIARN
ncbi:MAG: HlyD family secretion protein [Luteibaculum sp.]